MADAEQTKRASSKLPDPIVQQKIAAQSDEVAAAVNTFLTALACTSAQDDDDPTAQADIVTAGLEQVISAV